MAFPARRASAKKFYQLASAYVNPKYSRKVREKFGKNSGKIREKFGKNSEKLPLFTGINPRQISLTAAIADHRSPRHTYNKTL